MNNNVVVFGPVQSGKSTLMGFLASSCLNDRLFAIEAYQIEKRIKRTGLTKIKDELLFPGFLSLDKDELTDQKEMNPPGTTKRVHRKKIFLQDQSTMTSANYTFIDTPGTRDHVKEQYGYMFEGDIGLYVISAIDVQELMSSGGVNREKQKKDKRRLFSPLQFWIDYKRADRLVVALTKTDLIKGGQDEIRKLYQAVTNIVAELADREIPVVPTSIRLLREDSLYHRIESNVIRLDREMPWYTGKTLIEILNDYKSETRNDIDKPFYIAAAKEIRKVSNSSDYALRVQCVNGNLHVGESVVLGPVKNRDNRQIFLKAIVKSLKIEDGEITQLLPEGMIGGVVFKSLNALGNRNAFVSLRDLKLMPTTELMSEQFVAGNVASFCMKEDELGGFALLALSQLKPKEQLRCYWMGKPIIGDVVELYRENGYLYISIAHLADIRDGHEKQFALPNGSDISDLTLETLAELRYVRFNFYNNQYNKETVNTHLLFRIANIRNIDRDKRYKILFYPMGYYWNTIELEQYFGEERNIHFDEKSKAMVIQNVKMPELMNYYRLLRAYTAFEGAYAYELKFEVQPQ